MKLKQWNTIFLTTQNLTIMYNIYQMTVSTTVAIPELVSYNLSGCRCAKLVCKPRHRAPDDQLPCASLLGGDPFLQQLTMQFSGR